MKNVLGFFNRKFSHENVLTVKLQEMEPDSA